MRFARPYILLAALTAFMLAGCATTSAALEGVGGVFTGAGEDVRRLAR